MSITSHDIAKEAGVSQTTVSRALRGDPRVDPKTAARIVRVADRRGYMPNATARSLVTRRTRTIAVVVADIKNPFYPELVEALHEALGRSGYRMVLVNERTDTRGQAGLPSSTAAAAPTARSSSRSPSSVAWPRWSRRARCRACCSTATSPGPTSTA